MSHSPGIPLSDERLDVAALDRWMSTHVRGYRGPLTLEKFPSGQSNPTYRIEAASGLYVMRRKPFGPLLPSAHAVDREYRLLAALHPTGFPVPEPYRAVHGLNGHRCGVLPHADDRGPHALGRRPAEFHCRAASRHLPLDHRRPGPAARHRSGRRRSRAISDAREITSNARCGAGRSNTAPRRPSTSRTSRS